MEDMIAELKRKREETLAMAGNGKKYVKRAELERAREQKYREEQAVRDRERAKKSKAGPRPDILKELRDSFPSREKDLQSLEAPHLSRDEVIKQLRTAHEPITLFGESEYDSYKRLLKLQHIEVRTGSEFQKNMEDSNASETQAMLKKQGGDHSRIESSHDDVDTSEISATTLEKDPSKVRRLLPIYLNRVIREWAVTLEKRPIEERETARGKITTSNQKMCGEYLKPFYKQLRKDSVSPDVLLRVTEICDFMQQREYQKANDAYIKLSIGNAPWPIGVTAVGIHERSNRDKLSVSNVGHVLNDEVERKWIQSIKRLITFVQSIRPPEDLSKAVG